MTINTHFEPDPESHNRGYVQNSDINVGGAPTTIGILTRF